MPAETIKNLAHRFKVLAANVYADKQDPQARDTVIYMKFLQVIPWNLRIKIKEEGIADYRAAVEKKHDLQEILHKEKVLYALPSMPKSEYNFEEQLLEISQKINALTFKPKESSQNDTNKNSDDRPTLN